jgi:peptidoglycan-N-acetylglucosamine deacetylase
MRVAITIDTEMPDHPWHVWNGPVPILDTLRDYNSRATFFVQGRWAAAFPDIAARIAREGHLVGSHSSSHAPMSRLSPAGIEAELQTSTREIVRACGVDPRPWFRLPFFDGANEPWIRARVRGAGYQHVPVNVHTSDWEQNATTEGLVGEILDGVQQHDPAVVIMHSWPNVTNDSFAVLLQALNETGANVIRLDELERDELRAIGVG